MSSAESRFNFLDYAVFGGMLLVSALVGVYHSYGAKTTNDLLTANRSLGVVPAAISIVASFISSISLLGLPSESYRYGTQLFIASALTQPLSIYIASKYFVPVFYTLGVTSVFQYLEIRFNRSLRTICSVIYCITNLFYMGVALYGPALALSQVTGMDKWSAVIATGFVCTFYTTMGGMKAVVWSDVFQSVVLISALIVVVLNGCFADGGLVKVFSSNYRAGRLEAFNMDPGPYVRHTFFTVTVGSLLSHVAHYGTNQSLIQRYLSLPSLRKAKSTLWTVLPIKLAVYCLIAFSGLVVTARYLFCDPISTKQIESNDQILPLFVMETLGSFPGIPGLFVTGIFSGSLSVISAGINSMAAVLLEDVVKTMFKPNINEKESSKFVTICCIGFGALTLVGAVVASKLGNIIQASITVFSLLGSPVTGVFFLGIFFPTANARGALVGILTGFFVNLCLGIGLFIYQPKYPGKLLSVRDCVSLYEARSGSTYNASIFYQQQQDTLKRLYDVPPYFRVSYMYFGVLGVTVTGGVALIASKYFQSPRRNQNSTHSPTKAGTNFELVSYAPLVSEAK